MTILQYEPWSLLDRLSRQNPATPSFLPAVDVVEEKDRYILRADLPGVGRDDIEITTDGGVLTLKGERKIEVSANVNYAHTERAGGSFVRRFTLPETAQTEAIKATHVNGVLEITIPKQPMPQVRRINIDA